MSFQIQSIVYLLTDNYNYASGRNAIWYNDVTIRLFRIQYYSTRKDQSPKTNK